MLSIPKLLKARKVVNLDKVKTMYGFQVQKESRLTEATRLKVVLVEAIIPQTQLRKIELLNSQAVIIEEMQVQKEKLWWLPRRDHSKPTITSLLIEAMIQLKSKNVILRILKKKQSI